MYIRRNLFANSQLGNMGNWQQRHNDAVTAPRGPEKPLIRMLEGWAAYADVHAKRYESPVGDDGIMGAAWLDVGKALRTMLNGELGHLDGGTLDGFILGEIEAAGFDVDKEL